MFFNSDWMEIIKCVLRSCNNLKKLKIKHSFEFLNDAKFVDNFNHVTMKRMRDTVLPNIFKHCTSPINIEIEFIIFITDIDFQVSFF